MTFFYTTRFACCQDGAQSVSSLSQVPEPASPDEFSDEERQRHLLSLCQAKVRQEFGEKYYHVFEQYALNGRPAGEVGEEVGITRNAVYICKSRLLTRMQQIVDEFEFTD